MKRVLFALFGLLLSVTGHAAALPSGYTELTYVNMPAGSYLGVTGQSITSGYKIEFNFATTNLSNNLANYFGARASGVAAGGGFRVTKLSNQGIAMYGFDTTDAYESGAGIFTADTRYKYVYENGTCTLSSGGTDVLTHTYTVNDTSTITAFGVNAYTSNGTSFSASNLGIYFYGLKIWNAQGQLVADYVPAKYGDTVGLYDIVRNRFFENSGSGSFLPGEELSPCRNLLDLSNIQIQTGKAITADGSLISNAATNFCATYIPVQPSTTYTISGNVLGGNTGTTTVAYFRLAEYNSSQQFIVRSDGVEGSSYTFTTGTNTHYIRFHYVATADINTYQLKQAQCGGCSGGGTLRNYVSATGTGTQVGTPTPENPIDPVFFRQGDMILRAVGSGENLIADSYDASTGKITRNVGVMVLDGTEDWTLLDGPYPYLYSKISNGIIHQSPRLEINTHFPTGASIGQNNNEQSLYIGTKQNEFSALLFRYDSLYPSTAASIPLLKQWLAAQYAAGTPVIIYYPLATPVVEDWDGGATYCESGIKIATNLYNSAKFQNVIDALDTAVSTINTIVAGTIAQANSIGELASGKQTRPNPADSSDETCPTSCPNYRQCLLVEKDDGTPCWYEILDPFYNLFTPVIANDTNAASTTAQNASGLPAGYTLLDYITFDSTQVIDTGFIPDNETKIESKVYRTGDICWVYGAGATNPRVTLYQSTTGTNRWGNQSRNNLGFSANTEYTIIQDKNGLNINGTLYPWNSGTAGEFTCDVSLTIGNSNGATGGTRYFSGNLYYMKIWDNGTLVRDFVPCINPSNVVGLYDKVNDEFYTDTGLVAGNVVSSSPETVWTATFAANANNNIPAGTVYGTAMCNATSGTTNTAATAVQMSANNWTASGNYCWCRVTSVNTGGTSGAPSSEIWVYDGTSATCDSDCVGTCATSVGTGANKNFRRAISGLN